MKNRKIYKLIFPILILFSGIFLGCKKDDGPIKKDTLKDLQNIPAVSTAIDASGSQSIDLTNLGSFAGKFTVSLYFEGATPPEKYDVVVRKTNSAGTTVKVFKAGQTTLPASYSVNSADIQALFGTIALGDSYDFSVDLYANKGKKYEAFPMGGVGTASGPKSMPGFSEFARFGAICAYNPDIYEGTFTVVEDGWGDYSVGDDVQITRINNNQFSFKYLDNGSLPIVVTVNVANNVTSVAKQVYAPNGYGTAYGAFSAQTVAGSSDNFVAPCDEVFSVRLVHTVSAGSFGDFVFKAKKKH